MIILVFIVVSTRVADPDSFIPAPDLDANFFILDCGFGSESD